MKKFLAALFTSLIFCSVVFAENGPKTIDQAVEKFFKNRKLDPIEGIWNANYGTYGEANYAIVKIGKNKYKLWTITHTVSKLYNLNKNNLKFKNSQLIEDKGFFIGLPTEIMSSKNLDFLTNNLMNIDKFK